MSRFDLNNMFDILEMTIEQVSQSGDAWNNFLKSMAFTYKYDFKNQLLLYNQKPTATACASILTWNKLGRLVNKGEKGIPILAENGFTVKYVFDVSSTSIFRQNTPPFKLWKHNGDTANLLLKLIKEQEIVLCETENPVLIAEKEFINKSIEAVVCYRCAMETYGLAFNEITKYDIKTIKVLGAYISEMSQQILREIESNAKMQTSVLTNTQKLSETVSKDYDINLTSEEMTNDREKELATNDRGRRGELFGDERKWDGDTLHESGRQLHTNYGGQGRNDYHEQLSIREMGQDAPGILEGTQEHNLRGDVVGADVTSASRGNRQGSQGDGTADNGRNENSAGLNGGNEEQGLAQLRSENRKPTTTSERNSAKQSDLLQLTLDIPTQTEQLSLLQEAVGHKSVPAASLHDDELERILLQGSGVQDGKFRIYEFYKGINPKTAQAGAFLAKEYGWGGRSDNVGFLNFGGKGLSILGYKTISWDIIARKIGELVQSQKYLLPKELKHLEEYRSNCATQHIRTELVNRYLNLVGQQPDELWKTHSRNIPLIYDCGTQYAQGKDLSYAAHFKGDKVNMEILRTLSLIKDEGNGAQEAVNLINEFAFVRSEIDKTPEPEHCITFFKMGEFYESYGHEAEIVSKIFDFQLIQRGNVSLIGFPQHLLDTVKKVLSDNGFTITVVESETSQEKQFADNTLETPVSVDNAEDANNYSANLSINTTNEIDTSYSKPEKYSNNLKAIRTLKQIEAENRSASNDEQCILSKYSGWGGLSKYFEPQNDYYEELKDALTQEEYVAARDSTVSAFYTPPLIIKQMYNALDNFGFKGGKILEPACGTGNFFGCLPDEMRSNSQLTGFEIDSISGRIAKQLYQVADINIIGFEKSLYENEHFDVSIGNVPFGQFKVNDTKLNKYNFFIHDYFFAKGIESVRPGGLVAYITSKGTLDKENPSLRKYIARRAELIGAIRLPNCAFKSSGTETTTDIVFLKKRERMLEIDEPWIHLGISDKGIVMNEYFINHPEMIIGEMKMQSGQFGPESACVLSKPQMILEKLESAIQLLNASYLVDEKNVKQQLAPNSINEKTLQADPNVRNYSFTMVADNVYYRENNTMTFCDKSVAEKSKIKDYIALRDCTRQVIDLQLDNFSDSIIEDAQTKLSDAYTNFTKKHGLACAHKNRISLSDDASYNLVYALESVDENGKLVSVADIFSKRTIKPHVPVTHVESASEALALSLGEKACVDIDYMANLVGTTPGEIAQELEGVIFLNPEFKASEKATEYVSADEYLSGNIREKITIAKTEPEKYQVNIDALERMLPKPLTAAEISVRLGATWLPIDVVNDFVCETLKTPKELINGDKIKVHYGAVNGVWWISGKNLDTNNILANSTFGTKRINAYKIIEDTLNLKDVRIFDTKTKPDGSEKRILNVVETQVAQSKQEQLKSLFSDWIWEKHERRERLCELYNERFNSVRPREYDGSHLRFVGINPYITLEKHQVNAVARIIYGGNTLLAHVVGAGKTFEMIAAAQESKRLGLCNKSLFVVPNHLTQQVSADYLKLYPGANILCAAKKDFEPNNNRKRFCARIATGDYDAVIIGHSQFGKIPLSAERQQDLLQEQIDEISNGILDLKNNGGENFTIKQLVKLRKSIEVKLDRLANQERKDGLITFEQLGVDRLYVDEAHNFKNLFLYTKMRNVAGISQTEAQKSTDLYLKCRYIDEITDSRGVVFATGTPISNSMTELYTMQRYLQNVELANKGLSSFDAWASTFGETVTAIELAPEGTGYRAKTRFAKFYNLPELITMFKERADIQTADMLNLKVPKANKETIICKPSATQLEIVKELAKRADDVRKRKVEPYEDNMLKITNDGRKLALDSRLIDATFEADDTGKIAVCSEKVFKIWDETKQDKLTQLVFCDLSTPSGIRPIEMQKTQTGAYEMIPGQFTNAYDDLKLRLCTKGIPEKEIAYIHDADTDTKKADLFAKVRNGNVRVLIGSTAKMGAGTNVQNRLVALHHLDCPWRPSDLEQREGRILRQGNLNKNIDIFTYITENTFDAYLYQLVENKQKFISQVMTSKTPVRIADDIDEQSLNYAEIKALATGNPLIKEKMDLDIAVSKLKVLKSSFLNQKYALEDSIAKTLPAEIKRLESLAEKIGIDIDLSRQTSPSTAEQFQPIYINNVCYIERESAIAKLMDTVKTIKLEENREPVLFGEYRGFKLLFATTNYNMEKTIHVQGMLSYKVNFGDSATGNITRLENTINGLDKILAEKTLELCNQKEQLEIAKKEVNKSFNKDGELDEKLKRLNKLNILLNHDAHNENNETNESIIYEESQTNSNSFQCLEDEDLDFEM